ncbi:hypothetical protein C8C94_0909 [Acidovorax sp. 94]|nr:hypothetical protein C8C94_0909 [Acidovorax sp. 94]
MRVTFFRVAERKSPKKGRPCCLRPLRCATGQPGVLGHGVHRRTRCAPAALRSDNCGESVHEACALRRACHPAPCAPQAHPEGNPRVGHPHGPLLRSALSRGRKRLAQRRLGRAQQWPVWLFGCSAAHPLLAAPAAGRLWGGTRVGARVLRELNRRGCPSGAAQQQSEFHGAPRNRPAAGLPLRTAKGSQTGGRPFFGDFLSATRKKVTRTPGDSRPPPSIQACRSNQRTSLPQLRQTQPEQMVLIRTAKTIATSA